MSKNPRQAGSPSDNTPGSMARAVDLHRAGQLDAAASIYKEVLAQSPHDFDASHMLGVIALQQGQFETAQGQLTEAVSIRPRDAAAMGNLGISYLRDGKLEQARQWFEKALKIAPNSVPTLTNMGTVLLESGRTGEALPLARKAYKLDPKAYDTCNLLGACLLKSGEELAAADVLETAAKLQPDQAEAWVNLASVMRSLGKEDLANEYAYKAATLKPNSPLALGAQAAAQYDQGDIAGSIESYRKLLLLAPAGADTRVAYAHVLLADGLNEEALEQLQRAQALREKDLNIRWAGVMAHLKTVYRSEPERAASREAFGKALQEVKQWYEQTPKVESAFKAVGVNQPFLLAYHPDNNRDLLSGYGQLCAAFMSSFPLPATGKRSSKAAGSTEGARKLRLGVVSAQVKNHSVWNAITKGWLQSLDRSRFEVTLFQVDMAADEETTAAQELVSRFENAPRDLAGWAQTIREADLDVILYPEIGMHALTLKLACLRLAPVQAASWGHPETTGLPTIDLYISAAAFEPPTAAANYTERLVTLPNLGVYVEPLVPEARVPNWRALKLPNGEPLLLCPGTPYKYSPQYDDLWVQIAQQLGRKTLFRRSGGGRLVFFATHGEERNHRLETRLRAAFDAAGLKFESHVSFVPALARPDFFGLMREATLMLDTPGFSGFNTALQAIECGLPVLAFEGQFMRGRLASGIMRQLDLPGLVATSSAEFIQKAVALTRDADGRKNLQAQIMTRREKLFRDLTPVRALESCLLEAARIR